MPEQLDLTSLRRAITSLEDGLHVVSGEQWFDAQNQAVRNTLIAGVIQNFEFVYEICAKMIRRQLEREALTPGDVDQDNYRDLLRRAAETGLIADVEAWFGYRAMRNITAHTYDHEKAHRIYQGMTAFLADAQELLKHLEQRRA